MAGTIRRLLLCYRNQLVVLLTPFVLLPLPLLVDGQEALCGYVMILMAIYWCTEAFPIPVTGCIPVFLFPMLGLLSTKQVVVNYMKEIAMIFLGGLIVAISFEQCNLHKRLATRVLLIIGTQTRWLMLGFMLPTWFLSMWITNTATAAMMLPMVEAVLNQLDPRNRLTDNAATDNGTVGSSKEEEKRETPIGRKHGAYEVTIDNDPAFDELPMTNSADTSSTTKEKQPEISKENNTEAVTFGTNEEQRELENELKKDAIAKFNNLAKGLTLSVAYAANIGGTGTLTGTTPNLIMKGHSDQLWEDQGLKSPVNFPSWVVFGLPSSVLNLLLLWIYMQLYFLGIRFAEVAVTLLFTLLVLLWFFRDPDFLTGWSSGFEQGFIADAVPAMMMAVALFIIPKSLPRTLDAVDSKPTETLLDWRSVELKMPWSIVFIFGGGFSLANAATESGLSSWLGRELEVLDALPGWLMVLLLSLLVCLMTEVTSNSATCTLLMPIMASMAEGLGRNPLYLMFPIALSTSFAFMLPVSTPPNAIAFSFGRLTVMDMVKAGALINVFCALVVTLATHTWGMAYFDLDTIPWAVVTANDTMG